MSRVALGLVLVGTLLLASPAAAVICTIDAVPAATLLLPYFEVNLDNPNAETTLFTIANAAAAATLVKVTLWTDLGVPTLGFNVYLTGYGAQSMNLRDILVNGLLPLTADAAEDPTGKISPKGPLSQDTTFPGCAGVLPPPRLPSIFTSHLAAAHTGRASTLLGGKCAGVNHGDAIARGYVTVDVVHSCNIDFPTDPGYYGPGGLGTENVLWGDTFYVDSRLSYARGGNLVRIEAAPAAFKPGDRTFYGTFVNHSAADAREPLPTTWASRFLAGGPFDAGSYLVVWREPQTVPAPFPCGSPALTGGFPLAVRAGVVFDEQEHPEVAPATAMPPAPWAANRIQVNGTAFPVAYNFGWYIASFDAAPPSGTGSRQSWLGTEMSAHRKISVTLAGSPLDSGCGAVAPVP